MSTNSQKGDHAGLSHSFKFSAQWVKFLLSVDIQDETLSGRLQELNPLATRDLAEKHVLKLVEGFFGHCRAV